MGLTALDLEGLAKLDNGVVRAGIEKALERCHHDMTDRPGNGKDRVVTLKIVMRPSSDEKGKLQRVATRCEIEEKIPKRSTADYEMKPSPDGQLVFHELSSDDADQGTLFSPSDEHPSGYVATPDGVNEETSVADNESEAS